jgi:HSP20 family protein
MTCIPKKRLQKPTEWIDHNHRPGCLISWRAGCGPQYLHSTIKKGGLMKLMKSILPSLVNDGFLSGLLDDRFFDSDWMKRIQVVPAVNVVETEKEFEIEMAAPGLNKKDFNITAENGVLTVSYEKEKETETETEEDKKNYMRREYNYSGFSRSFALPENIKTEKVDARYENGVLKMILPKAVEAKVKPKAIEVH